MDSLRRDDPRNHTTLHEQGPTIERQTLALLLAFSVPFSALQMGRHAGNNDVWLEEQCAFQHQGALVVQQMLPPPRRYELWQHNRYHLVRVQRHSPINVAD